MQEHSVGGRHGRSVVIDLCEPCQSFWFDGRESLQLTPAATLALFRIIGERAARPRLQHGDVSKCPRCRARLRATTDMQRATRFSYFKCPNEHGRLISFFDFLREKDFIRPLTARQIDELRRNVQIVNCSNCGAPIDLVKGSACAHCDSPVSMLDMNQTERVVEQLRNAERPDKEIDPALALNLARARREVERAFSGENPRAWFDDVTENGLVGAGLHVVATWLRRKPND
jgi:hypothetical protein